MQDTLPLNLLKLDSRLQEILGLVDLFLIDEVKTPQTKVAEAVDQFVADYCSGESGPYALFNANCRETWKRDEEFYGTHIFRVHELSGTLSNYRGSGKGLLGTVCEAILQFLVDSRCKVDWREHGEQLKRALLRYLSFRGHDFDTTPPATQTEPGKGNGEEDSANDPMLGERAQLVLTALRNNKAFDSDHRTTTADIAVKAAGKTADPNQFKEVIVELKEHGYVDTKEGRSGGCWLTVAGQQRADKL